MYFSGSIAIDPSKLTKIEVVKPDRFLKKILHHITLGKTSDKTEKETFTAFAIMNQIYNALKDLNINNIIRLSVNDHTFYLDEKGEKYDLDKAFLETETKLDPLESEVFDNIFMVLEHEVQTQKFLIEIKILKEHKVGEYPIQLTINGLLTEFKAKEGETREQLKQRMNFLFESQNKYDSYVDSQKSMFSGFLDNLSISIRKFIPMDDIIIDSNTKIIRPKEKVNSKNQIKTNSQREPVYQGYYGFDSFFFYSWLWASTVHSNNIMIHNTDIVDSEGSEIMSVGDEGFNAGDTNTLNDEGDFEAPAEGDVSYFGENEYESELAESDLFGSDMADMGASETVDSGWLSGGGSDFGDFGDFGDI